MGTTSEHRSPAFSVRSGLSLGKVFAWAVLATAVLLLLVVLNGCWLFRYGPGGFAVFVYVFVWLVVFFALGTKWRFVLLVVTLVAAIPLVGLRGIAEQNARPEWAAVEALHQIQSSLRAYNIEHQEQVYPDTLPVLTLSQMAEKFYRFQYLPSRSADGKAHGYVVQATPARRDCEFHRSFTLLDDGKIFWTLEPRAASVTDTLLRE
jgi:hypothetical protein